MEATMKRMPGIDCTQACRDAYGCGHPGAAQCSCTPAERAHRGWESLQTAMLVAQAHGLNRIDGKQGVLVLQKMHQDIQDMAEEEGKDNDRGCALCILNDGGTP